MPNTAKAIGRATANKGYAALLAEALPSVIRSEAQNTRYLDLLERLNDKPRLTREERQLADLLTLLIEEFEERQYALPKATPVDALRELMQQHDLQPEDLTDVFGSRRVAQAILRNARKLSVDQIRKLVERFQVPAELFL